MTSRKRMITDLLFAVQIIGAFLFCGAYILRSIKDVTGSSIAQFGLVAAFLVFNLALGIDAHRSAPSRVTRQAVATYVIWLFLVLGLMIAAGTNPAYQWNEKDTATLITALILTVGVVMIGIHRRLPLNDAMMKGSLAIASKAVPQLLLAWKFLAEGASGTPGLSIMLGHMTILVRIGQISFMVRDSGWNRSVKWLMASELSNEITWAIATLAWFIA